MAAGDPGTPKRNFSSTAVETSLQSSIAAQSQGASNTSFIVASVSGFPAVPFTLVVDPDTSKEEVLTVTAANSTTLTVTRGEDSTQAVAHSAGAVVRHGVSGRDFREEQTHIAARGYDVDQAILDLANQTHVHGLAAGDGSVVGTSKSQTLTNKTLTSPTITGTGSIAGTFTGNLTGNVTGNVSGSASSAASLTTARDFQLVGDVEAAAVSFNGTSNVTLTTSIAAGSIVNADVNASAAIDKTKISGTAVTLADSGTITSTMIADGAIVNADINASAAIDKTKISGTAVTLADSGTVTSTMIANDTIVNADVNSLAAIAKSKLDLSGQITSADIADGAIVNTDIASTAAIAISKLAVDPLDRANHTGTQLASTISNFDTQVRTSRLDQMAAPTGSLSINSQKLTNVADPTSNQDAVTLKYFTDQKGAANGVASLDSGGKIPSSQLPAIAIAEVYVVASQAAMLALPSDVGEIAIRTDVNKSFILAASPASTLANWKELLTPPDAVQSVDGLTGAVDLTGIYLAKTGGTLTGALTLHADPSTNLGAATKQYVDAVAGSATAAASSATAAASSATAAANSYDSFDDRYLGSKSTPPTVDNDGNPLITGALYWNSVDAAMYAWTGSAWGSISSTAAIFRYRYTATGGETSKSGPDDNGVTLSYLPGKEQVYLNGVLLVRDTDYSASNGTSITSLAALTAGDILEIITFTAFDLATAIPNTIVDAKGDLLAGTAADTVGKLTVGTNGTVLMADSSTATGLKWSAYDPLPSQTGNTGEFLTTDGTTTSWAAVSQVPSQTGNAGLYLTTNGSTASWATVSAGVSIAKVYFMKG